MTLVPELGEGNTKVPKNNLVIGWSEYDVINHELFLAGFDESSEP